MVTTTELAALIHALASTINLGDATTADLDTYRDLTDELHARQAAEDLTAIATATGVLTN